MADGRSTTRRRPGRVRRGLERALLGVAIGAVTFVLERRLRRALGRASARRVGESTAELRR